MDEFEIMRQQLASMKQQLDTQKIVNNDLMRKVMRSKASWMNKFVKAELIAMPFIYLLVVGICFSYGVSQWYSFAFLVFGGIDAILDIRTVRIPIELFSSSSILGLKKFLLRQKRERFAQTCISGAVALVWLILLVYAMITSGNSLFPGNEIWESAKNGGIVGGIVGGIIGLIVIIVLYSKMQRTNDRILADIEQIENEE